MAWPKLRNKSSGPLMTEGNRSGAAHDGARSQGKEAEGAPEGPARLPFLRAQGPRKTEAAGGPGAVRGPPARDAPRGWPGAAGPGGAAPAGDAPVGGRGQSVAGGPPAEETAAVAAGAEATGPEPAAA